MAEHPEGDEPVKDTSGGENPGANDAIADDAIADDARVDDATVDDAAGDDAAVTDSAGGDAPAEDAVVDDAVVNDAVVDDAVVDDAVEKDLAEDSPEIEDPSTAVPVADDAVVEDPVLTGAALASTQVAPTPVGRTAARRFAAGRFAAGRFAAGRSGVTKKVAIVGARLTVGLIGVGVAAATVLAASVVPLPTIGATVGSTVVTPVSAPQQRVCPGPVLRLGDARGADANVANTIGTAIVVHGASGGTVVQDGLVPADNPANTPPQRLTLTAGGDSGAQDILAGSQSQSVDIGDYRGFAAAVCQTAAAESWLVGGSTLTGRTTLIMLSNPSSVQATVDLEIFAEKGQVTADGTKGIVLQPGGQRVFSLAGFAPNVASPVVHVVSTGGEVVANLEQSIIRTLDPGGVDLVGSSARANTLNVIPGVVLGDHGVIESMLGQGGYEDAVPILRILVPGSVAANAQLTIAKDGDTNAPSTVDLKVDPGIATDFPLQDFPDGTYTVSVKTDLPAVVGARSTALQIAGPVPSDPTVAPKVVGTDFAWFAAAPELRSTALVTVAPGPSPTLSLTNATAQDTTVTLDGPGVPAAPVSIPAGHTVTFAVSANGKYQLSGFAELHAAVSYSGTGAVAGFAVVPPEPASGPITVFRGIPRDTIVAVEATP